MTTHATLFDNGSSTRIAHSTFRRLDAVEHYDDAATNEVGNVVRIVTLWEAPPQPPGFRDLSELTRKYATNAERREGIAQARRRLGTELFGDVETLASLRLAKGLSQAELASQIGTMQPNISRMEAGCGDVLLSTMDKLAAALDVDLNRLGIAIKNSAQER